MSLDAYINACHRAACEQMFPVLPTVGQIRRLADEHVHGIAESPEAAYARVLQARSRHGLTGSADARRVLGEDAWTVLAGIGGWRRFCELLIDEQGTFFAQFRDGWLRLTERESAQRRLPPGLRPRLTREVSQYPRIGHRPEGATA